MRRKRDLTSGSHIRPDKYLAMPRGLSASLERTVRESGVTVGTAAAAPGESDDGGGLPFADGEVKVCLQLLESDHK